MGNKIYLNNKQAALILHEDGEQKLYLPPIKEDDIIPHTVSFLTTIAVLLKTEDKRFQRYMAKRWNEIVKESEK